MKLLRKGFCLLAFPKTYEKTNSLPLTALAPTLFPFFRHTIPNVRLAVVKTLLSFMAVPTLPRDWIAAPFLRLLFQNLIAEERSDIRDASILNFLPVLLQSQTTRLSIN